MVWQPKQRKDNSGETAIASAEENSKIKIKASKIDVILVEVHTWYICTLPRYPCGRSYYLPINPLGNCRAPTNRITYCLNQMYNN